MDRKYLKWNSPRYEVTCQLTFGKVIDTRNFFENGTIRVLYSTIGNHLEVDAFVLYPYLEVDGSMSGEIQHPPVGSRVVIGLLDSALHFPIVLGVLTPGIGPLPLIDEVEEEDIQNGYFRFIKTPSGTVFAILDDRKGNSYIKMRDESGNVQFFMDFSKQIIQMSAGTERIELNGTEKKTTISATYLEIHAEKEILMSAPVINGKMKDGKWEVENVWKENIHKKEGEGGVNRVNYDRIVFNTSQNDLIL